MTLIPRIIEGLAEAGLGELPVLAGGIIPEDDAKQLLALGLREVYGPGTDTGTVIDAVKRYAEERRSTAS
jgi:methylmalonyl-CoA mutase cobalamin-binding domain/chain